MTHLKVVVRVRPMSEREINSNATPIVSIEYGKTISITNIKVPELSNGDSRDRVRRFTFDRCFGEDATQENIFETVAEEIKYSVQNRYNACVLAYGQSSSGKTYTMCGNSGLSTVESDSAGITPRLCRTIFNCLQEQKEKHGQDLAGVGNGEEITLTTVSYLEIYNEKVRDLFTSSSEFEEKTPLKIREHPRKGPYVQGLSEKIVHDSQGLLRWLKIGNACRRVAATTNNPHSSRSHSVFTVTCGGRTNGFQIHLVDLAGSERPGTRSSTPQSTFREGANINRSLVALGNVISALAEQSVKYAKQFRKRFIPFRDSILTWLLKDTLGGNSKTLMIATVSPSSTCYNETVNTLRFGQRAKQIEVQPVSNEDPKERIIRSLRLEIESLKLLLLQSTKITGEFSLQVPTHNLYTNYESPLSPISNFTCSSFSLKCGQAQLRSSLDSLISECVENLPLSRTTNEYSVQDQCSTNTQSISQNSFSVYDSNSTVNDNLTNCEYTLTKNDFPVISTCEKLLPVMNITTSVDKTVKSKLRRTISVLDANKRDSSSTSKEEVQPDSKSLTPRKQSLEKPKKSPSPLTRSPASVKSVEIGTVTEQKGPLSRQSSTVKPRVDSLRRSVPKPRSRIVAAVTQRLYNRVKKKEIGTGTDDLQQVENSSEVPKELSICSNARQRLRELTQKAIKAHKWKTVDTQTDLFPVLRVKEISTDVDDLRLALIEVKHAESGTETKTTSDAGVDCCSLQNFVSLEGTMSAASFLVTRTCGTQSTDSLLTEPSQVRLPTTSISFTKYLQAYQEPRINILNPSTPSLIYTNSVNLNISHNFPQSSEPSTSTATSLTQRKVSDANSEDSLEGEMPCLNTATPDLISNHNSLEQQNYPSSTKTTEVAIQALKYATTSILQTELFLNEEQEFPLEGTPHIAEFSIESNNCNDRVTISTLPSSYTSETFALNEEEYCKHFKDIYPQHSPVLIHECTSTGRDQVTFSEPLVLKSIMKHEHYESDSNLSSMSAGSDRFQDVQDSLNYHQVNMKRVRFLSDEHLSCSGNTKMVEVMSNFLREATTLMTTLTLAATKIDKSTKKPEEVRTPMVVNDMEGLAKLLKATSRKHKKCCCKRSSRHCCKNSESMSTQTLEEPGASTKNSNTEFLVPANKFDLLVKDSCDRLEHCVTKLETKIDLEVEIQHEDFLLRDHSFSEVTPGMGSIRSAAVRDPQWLYSNKVPSVPGGSSHLTLEDTSLESNYTCSDYGSLPRRSRSKRSGCSPSAYLRQLTSMRRNIVDATRQDFVHDHCQASTSRMPL